MIGWLCYAGRHQWSDWRVEHFIGKPRRRWYRQCLRCGRREWK